jgi:alpha-L-rhamnosidase
MNTFRLSVVSLLIILFDLSASASPASLLPADLRCEYRQEPTGLDVVRPRLSWTLQAATAGARNLKQTGYQVLVASEPGKLKADQGDLWDSGTNHSDAQNQVQYGGKSLVSRLRCFWKVRVWDQDGAPSEWSAPATWSMGLLEKSDWNALWIADEASATNASARGPLNGYHSEIAKSADSVKWVAVDLGTPQELDAVRLFPARPYDWQPDTPGFLFPLRFRIEAASRPDFSDAKTILDHSVADEPNPGTNAPMYAVAPVTARYVRVIVTRLNRRDGDNFAFALAEMQILKRDENLAAGAKVTALDSIETGPWSKINLTDGVLETVKPGGGAGALRATMVRKSFTIARPVSRATAYVSALGLYELHLNGQRVGDQLLAPEWTSYQNRVQYQVHDVTPLLRPGENAIGAMLGEGWFAGRLMAVGRFAYGTHPRFLFQLELEFADGSVEKIVSDGTWSTTTDGPIRSSGIYDGESYDARKEMPGWDAPGFQTSTWRPAVSYPLDSRQLVWQPNEPIRVVKELKPVRIIGPKPGVFVFDLGQNMVGWCRIRAVGAAGQMVTIRHAEMLNEDRTLYTANLRGAPQIDHYTPAVDGEFTFEPRFTYHGFRFVELSGLAKLPSSDAVLGRVFHSTSPLVGTFECSDPSLNQLMQNILWTQRANLMSSPNDCPQRDERFGWMGDIQSFAQTAIFNMDMAAFFTKFARDIRDDQAKDGRFPDFAPHPGDPNTAFSGAPAWADAGVIVPWRAYQNYGDTRILADQFEAARRWVDYIHKANPDLVWAKSRNNDYNDWLNGDWIKQTGWPAKGGSVPNPVFATAFFAHSTELVSKMATVLGRTDEARTYGTLFERIRSVFNERFVALDGHIEGDTQGGYALALSFDLLPEALRPKAKALLVENIHRYGDHLSTGIQTTHRAMLELTRQNSSDLAWQLLTNRTFPSWLYMVDNGATTIWERWDGFVKGRGFQDAGMNSFNHWAFGAVGEWMWRNIAGLNPDDSKPGWKHFIIAPKPGAGVNWAGGDYRSIRGRIACHWKLADSKFVIHVSVPPNTSASIRIPTIDGSRITEAGQTVATAAMLPGCAVVEVGSGDYDFVSPFRP